MKQKFMTLAIALMAMVVGTQANAAVVVAYWDQNSNDLTGGGFGFEPGSFPQAADIGTGSITIGTLDTTLTEDGAYDFIPSFAGTTLNAQPTIPSGGSFAPEGGPLVDGVPANNGAYWDINVPLTGFFDPILTWAQRGTSSGFNSRAVSYSTDGVTFTTFATDTGVLGSSFTVATFDFTGISELANASTATFRVTLDGATGVTGNNRFDNITVTATAVPEPSSVALLGVLGVAGLAVRRRRMAAKA